MSRIRSHLRVLRPALLALLVFGLILTPILGQLGAIHDVEHAVLAGSGEDDVDHHRARAHAHGHHHDHGPDRSSTDAGGDEDGSNHADGSHGLLHLSTGVTVALPDASLEWFPSQAVDDALPIPAAPRLPGDRSSLPFRPPIA
jgi:hypothetical protein